MKRTWYCLLGLLALAGSALAQPTLSVNDASHDYLTLNYYINEPSEFEMVFLDLYPNEGNVEMAQIWGNVNRRDRATLGDQDFASVPGPGPGTTNYFVGFPMTNAGSGRWTLAMPLNKTGAYRLTGRYKVTGDPNWRWVGGRDTAIMVSPKKSRDVVLYEMMVNVINATGDTEGTRSTFEDLMNPGKPANLDYFENLGVNTLWIQPIHPIGDHACIDKSQGPGSPYSIQNMWEVAPFHSQDNTRSAGMNAFSNFAAAAKAKNIDFFFDIIFNHTSWDAEIGRDPANPEQLAPNPAALIKDILPQWYSRYSPGYLGCDEYGYNQSLFAFQLPARNSGEIGPAPAERADFGKWPDVADLFWGTYPALFEPQTDTDAYWDITQPGADVRRMTEYFAYFGKYWIEKSNGTLGGFRCDYAQGLPPQAWEYFVNKIRQTKWDFIFMAESLDGGNVSKRAGRHMDIINQNWVWQVLENAGTTTGFRGIIDGNKQDYGYAGIMRGIINHDQNAPADVWYSFSRYAVGAIVDGAPQLYQGQELGYRDGYGFSQFRTQFGRDIPHIFKWHNMQTLWNNRNATLENAYRRVNIGRMRNVATRLHDQWYLDRMDGSPHQQIFSVLKYERFGWDPAHQNVMLNFVSLTPQTGQSGTFKLSDVQAVYLNPTRTYNIRNLSSENPNNQVWPTGRTGQDIMNNGITIDFPTSGDWAFVQMLKLEEHGTVGPVDPWVTVTPENPEGCEQIAIRYNKALGPLGAGPVYIHIGRNGWQDVIEPNPQLANDGDNWVYYHDPLPGTEVLNFVFNNGAGTWDSNFGEDWSVTINGCTGSVPVSVWTDPASPQNCEQVTIYYDTALRVLSGPVYIHVARNGWQDLIAPPPVMTQVGASTVWSYTYTPQVGTETLNFVFHDGNTNEVARVWDNNNGLDWSRTIAGCGTLPDFSVTRPPGSVLTVGNSVSTYTLEGTGNNMTGDIVWTNALTGWFGSFPAAASWAVPLAELAVGSNVFTFTGTLAGGGAVVTNAQDNAGNYGGGWTNGSNQGTGFGVWSLESGGTAGHFVGGDGWGFWSHEGGNYSAAARAFAAPLAVGQTFRVRMKNGWIWEEGGSVGIALRGDADEKWVLYFNGGATQYAGTDGNTSVSWTDQGVDIAFTLTGATAYSVTLTPVGGSPVTYTGTFTGSINNVRAWSANNGTDDESNSIRDYFINNLAITSAGGGSGIATSITVTIIRSAGGSGDTDSNGDGVSDAFYIANGLDPMTPGLGSQIGPNGMSYYQSFQAGLNPNSMGDFFGFSAAMMSTSAPGRLAFQWNARPQRSYRVMVSRNGIAGPYTNEVASRSTIGNSSYDIVVEDPASVNFPHSFYRIELTSHIDVGGGTNGGLQPVTVNASPGSTVFTNAGGIAVTLSVSGVDVTNSTYTIQGGSTTIFTNGQVITVGDGFANGQSASLTLLGQNVSGNSDQKVYTYSYNAGGSGLVLTNVGGTHFYVDPTNNQVFINSAGYPEGSTVAASIVACVNPPCDGAWPLIAMQRNPDWDNGDWWSADMGIQEPGTVISFAIMMSDEFDNEVWDNNNDQNYTITIPGGGGGTNEPGGLTPYSTNPTKGSRVSNGSITINGTPGSKWSNSNLIAIDMANDDPRSLGDNWTMHEPPIDITHAWASWDDNNLYLAWQFVDITDVLDPANAGGAGSGKIGSNDGILQWIVIDTIPGQGATNDVWGKLNTWAGANKPNYQIYLAGSLWQGYVSRAVDGVFALDDGGVNYMAIAAAGISVAKGDTYAGGSELWGVGDADDRYNPGAPSRNFIAEGHNVTRDSFYEMSIPLSFLGITAGQLESNGIGIMIGAGSESSMDCIPHDETTLDTPGVESYNSSFEWGDNDVFTSPFARIGN